MSDVLVRIFDPRYAYLDPKTGIKRLDGQLTREDIRDEMVTMWWENGLFAPGKAKPSNLYVKFVYEPDTLATDKITVVSDSTIGSQLFREDVWEDKPTEDFQTATKANLSDLFGLDVCFWHRWVKGKFS